MADTRASARGKVSKIDEDKRLVFGWAYVAKHAGEQVVDHSGDFVVDFEKDFADQAYDYVLHSREGDAMHDGPAVARLVESVVFTKSKLEAMGLEGDVEGWFVGFRVDDDEVWKRVKSGDLADFSIAGNGVRENAGA